jgi:hypothetical protein
MLWLLYYAYVIIAAIAVSRTRGPATDALDGDDWIRMEGQDGFLASIGTFELQSCNWVAQG